MRFHMNFTALHCTALSRTFKCWDIYLHILLTLTLETSQLNTHWKGNLIIFCTYPWFVQHLWRNTNCLHRVNGNRKSRWGWNELWLNINWKQFFRVILSTQLWCTDFRGFGNFCISGEQHFQNALWENLCLPALHCSWLQIVEVC